jgi:hypothetical protein
MPDQASLDFFPVHSSGSLSQFRHCPVKLRSLSFTNLFHRPFLVPQYRRSMPCRGHAAICWSSLSCSRVSRRGKCLDDFRWRAVGSISDSKLLPSSCSRRGAQQSKHRCEPHHLSCPYPTSNHTFSAGICRRLIVLLRIRAILGCFKRIFP